MEGYLKKNKPDINWWQAQIQAGERFRDDLTHRSQWETYNQYYRGNFKAGIFPKNIFFSMRRSMVPRIYFRNPSVSVLPKKPGARNVALARVLEQVFNSLISSMGMKEQIKQMVDTAFTTGTGVGKLGFGAEFTPTPSFGITEAPIGPDNHHIEINSGVQRNMPWFQSVPTNQFILPENTISMDSAYFQAHRVFRHLDDVIADPRFKKFKRARKRKHFNPGDFSSEGINQTAREQVELLEIRDRRTKQVMVFAPFDSDEPIYIADDELQTISSSPYYLYSPNPDDMVVWGISDASILEPFQLQLNDLKTKMMQHARTSIVKFMSEEGAINAAEAEKLFNEDVQAVVQVANLRGVQIIEANHIPETLFRAEESLMQDVREIMGFSRNDFGEYQARSHGPTATETRAVRESSELRVDERRDMLSDLLVNIFNDVKTIIFRHWTQEQVIKVVGPDGYATWVEFTGDMLSEGQYEIKIDPDSSVPETRAVREERARDTYGLLSQNPLVDNTKLTEYLIRETRGINPEDLLPQNTQSNPQNIDQFSQRFQDTGAQLAGVS
jgi:hypothetical protein